jgi:serine/threonine protein kinase
MANPAPDRTGDSEVLPDVTLLPSSGTELGPALDTTQLGTTNPANRTLLPALAPAEATVEGYDLLGELGRGGMGVVYRARQRALNRMVALKMVLSGVHAGAEDLARFRAEAEVVARLQHPNIVQIYEIGEEAGRPYLALELVDGGTLQKKLAGTPQPTRTAAHLVEILARAIHVAHQRGVIHRDLKPGNVLLAVPLEDDSGTTDEDGAQVAALYGVPKVTDFGLAKRLGHESQHTRTGEILGTPWYMAPEQARGKAFEAGRAADVWALGAILYDMLTGRPPFKGVNELRNPSAGAPRGPGAARAPAAALAEGPRADLFEVPGEGAAPALRHRARPGRRSAPPPQWGNGPRAVGSRVGARVALGEAQPGPRRPAPGADSWRRARVLAPLRTLPFTGPHHGPRRRGATGRDTG